MFQTVLVCLLFRASVYYSCFLNRCSHRPINHSVFIEVCDWFAVEFTFISVFPNVSDQRQKEFFVDSITDDVLVWPCLGVGRSERPSVHVDEYLELRWESHDYPPADHLVASVAADLPAQPQPA